MDLSSEQLKRLQMIHCSTAIAAKRLKAFKTGRETWKGGGGGERHDNFQACLIKGHVGL